MAIGCEILEIQLSLNATIRLFHYIEISFLFIEIADPLQKKIVLLLY